MSIELRHGLTVGQASGRPSFIRRILSASAVAFAGVVATSVAIAGAAPCDPISSMDYVAMGDSYSAGFGLLDASGSCFRSANQSYPELVNDALGFATFNNVTCSGAETADFYAAQGSNPAQLSALSASTDVVTMTIGGNDLGFTDILTNCALLPDCRGTYGGSGLPTLTAQVSGPVGDAIEAALVAAAAAAPNAEIFIMGYPDILPAGPTGLAWNIACLPTSGVISDAERTELRSLQAALNAEIAARAAAAGAKVHYVDTYAPSIGHDLCSPSKWVDETALYHPTVAGMAAIADIVGDAITTTLDAACAEWLATSTTTTTTTTAPPSSTSSSTSTTTTAPGGATTTVPAGGSSTTAAGGTTSTTASGGSTTTAAGGATTTAGGATTTAPGVGTPTDADGDGLPNELENLLCGSATCVDPDADSDDDGVPDYQEQVIGELCGAVDCTALFGTDDPNELLADSDGDQIPDLLESAVCGSSSCLDVSADADGDGLPDFIDSLVDMICSVVDCSAFLPATTTTTTTTTTAATTATTSTTVKAAVLGVTVSRPSSTPLARTGASGNGPLLAGFLLVAAGVGLLGALRRYRR